ncbi:MAG: type IV pilus twitching motility protein PilT [Candidatus Hydrogenedentes bacterium]|nr:type IV pilus twitching motility protein PilT [Candidatus Hydrogenedentota bacterium]
MKDFAKLLQRAVQRDASDIHIKMSSPVYFRVDGDLTPLEGDALLPEQVEEVLNIILTPNQKEIFSRRGEIDLAFTEKGVGRFRVNVFRQRGNISIVMRRIKTKILNFEQLCLPQAVERFAQMVRGLVLITGTTGSGKSTTLAAIVDYINEHRKCHVITIEDPIEYLHYDKMAVINQREITIDTQSFAGAVKAAMRQDPDVILVGEMRDIETFQAAISAAETGHLVFSTLHTANTMQTIDRIIDLYPSNQQDQIRSQLSLNLKAVMCQRLLPRADGSGRVPACEVMFVTPAVRKLIKENRIVQIPLAMQQGREESMQGFNDSLYGLVRARLISLETAMAISDNPEELNMMLQGIRLSQQRGGILREA